MSLQPRLFGTHLDVQKNEIRNSVMQNLSSAPSSPVEGLTYYDTTLHQYGVYQNGAWAYFADKTFLLNRANHTGTQTSSTISDLATTVKAYTLDSFAAPVADVSMNSHKLTNVATPVSSTDAANKAYVDNSVQGLTQKPTAMAATAAALPTNTYSNGTAGLGATLTASANAALVVDGYTVAVGDVILVKNEATQANNGLYTVTATGSGSAAYVLTRSTDMATSGEYQGAFIPVGPDGTANKNTIWLCGNTAAPTVGTTAITFTQIAAPSSYSAGNGLTLASTTFSAVADTGITVSGTGIKVDHTKVPYIYTTTFGDGTSTSFTITHNLGTQAVIVQIYYTATPYQQVEFDVQHTSTTQITINTNGITPTSGQFTVVILG